MDRSSRQRSTKARPRAGAGSQPTLWGRARDDSGNLIAVLVLVVVLAALAAVTLAAVIPSFGTATTSQNGEQAVAQANSGLSDALLQLDQMGDQVSSFCVGSPPASLLSSSGLSSCTNQGSSAPVADAPGVQYYLADVVTGTLTFGVTNEVQITSKATVSGQSRTATEIVYREANSFGLFAVGSVTVHGNSSGAAIGAAGGDPLQVTAAATINFGTGPDGTLTCTGGSSSAIVWIGENGAVNNCSGNPDQTTTLTPQDPSFCIGSQVSTAFKPCISTGSAALDACSNCATTSTKTYCPLPGIGFKTQPTVSAAPTPAQNAVFDCTSASPGGAVFIGDTTGTSVSNAGCASTSPPAVSLPDDFTTIPPGNYYLDSNNVTICGIAPSALPIGPVNIFALPAACGSGATSGQCPFDTPTQANYTCPVGDSTTPQLNLTGAYINAQSSSTQTDFKFGQGNGNYVTPGEPNDFNLFWGGDSAISFPKDTVLDSNLYAPGASLTFTGSKYFTIGSLALNCFAMQGGPTLDFTYGEHNTQFLQGWTASKYSITP